MRAGCIGIARTQNARRALEYFDSDEQKALRDTVRRFAESRILPQAAVIDRQDVFPRALYRELADLGVFGVCVPEAVGGGGLGKTTATIVMEEIARCSGSVGNMFAIPVEMGVFLAEHGTAEQKKLIAPVLSGTLIPASAVTEPDHGSDVAGITTTAIRDGDEYLINGTKAWVTFGRIADFIVVFAKTTPEPGHRTVSCFLVEGDRPGIERGKREDLLGMHGLEDCQIAFTDVRIPVRNRIGPENVAFKMAMRSLNFSRLM